MSVLPVTNIINVTVTDTPSGLTVKNVNSLALFTNEAPNNIDPYDIYISAAQVASDYGTDSITAAMASAIFSQSPNVLSGAGRLVIIPMQAAVSARPGVIVTADISANLTSFMSVSTGDLKVTINGVANNLTNINTESVQTLADVATILQARLVDVTVTATSTQITFESKKVGTSSTVALGSVSGGAGTDLSGVGYLHQATASATAGFDSEGETLLEAIARTSGQVGYAGVITNVHLENAAIVTAADGIQALDLIWIHHVASSQDIAGIATTISTASDKKTRLVLYTAGMDAANLMKAAYAGRAFSVNFNGSNTSQTLNLKALATITPDEGITETLYVNAGTAGIDLYVDYEGVPRLFSTGGNDFFDNVYSDLALKFALQTAGFNFLAQTNTKVPQTESGMYGLKDAYEKIMEQFVRNGCIAPGSWTSSETFGNPEILRNNILSRGYYVYSLPITQQLSTEREARKAPLVQMAVKRAGSISTSDVLVLVNN